MPLFKRGVRSLTTPGPAPTPAPSVSNSLKDWSSIEAVRGEWSRAALDPTRDFQGFQQALSLYERDDYASLMQCATLFATALAHSLHGPGILRGDELFDTVHKTLYTSLCAPPDGRTFADSAQKAARLALTVMREKGWQPPSLGGTQVHFEGMMSDRGNHLLLCAAIAPSGQPWAGDLKAFFAVAPQPVVSVMPTAEAGHLGETTDRLHTTSLTESGDSAGALLLEAHALRLQGSSEQALATYSKAAELGSAQAMASAGQLSLDPPAG